jgi:hypothetical protein
METTSSGTTPSPDDLRTGLLEVLNVCPVDQCNPADCPLYPLREMDFARRLQWFNALNRSDLEYLAAYHYVCLRLRAGESPDRPAV